MWNTAEPHYINAMLFALLCNLVVEGVVVIPLLKRYLPLGRAVALFIGMNAMTLPIVWVFAPLLYPIVIILWLPLMMSLRDYAQQITAGYVSIIATGELLAVSVESYVATRVAPPEERRTVVLIVCLANVLSLGAAVLMQPEFHRAYGGY